MGTFFATLFIIILLAWVASLFGGPRFGMQAFAAMTFCAVLVGISELTSIPTDTLMFWLIALVLTLLAASFVLTRYLK